MVRRTMPVVVWLLVILTGGSASAQTGTTFIVNSTIDLPDSAVGNGICAASPGVCTLRAAIEEANATPALDTIAFAIGSGTQRIDIELTLPSVTRPVLIDGTTQPGYAGKPIVEIRGGLLTGDGLNITAGGSTVRGLVINGFLGDGIELSNGGGNVIEGNYIGTDVTGMEAVRNGEAGIRIMSSNNRVGGTAVAQRNVISGNGSLGIEGGIFIADPGAPNAVIGNVQGNTVQGNYIGIDAAGLNPIGNLGRGIAIHYASNNLIGGPQPGAGNLIAGNRASGVRIMARSTGNIVQKNAIGINKLGEIRRGEWPAPGILSNARGVQIRGDGNFVIENVIAGNTFDGVIFFDGTLVDLIPEGFPRENLVYGNYLVANGLNGIGAYIGENNRFITNSIFANALLGVNLANYAMNGVQPNDPGDEDQGTNGMQNYPVLTNAVRSGSQTTITGTLDSRPSRTYAIEVYATETCNQLGHGEGRVPIGLGNVTTTASGTGTFSIVVPAAIPKGMSLTALATETTGSTSEFSACLIVR